MKSVKPSRIDGWVAAPPSKSMMQRALAAAVLDEGLTTLRNPSLCDDAYVAVRVARALGARVCIGEDLVEVRGSRGPLDKRLYCGESGLCIRMFSAIASLFERRLVLYASGSLRARPVWMIEEPLRGLDAFCRTNGGLPPVVVRGPIRGGEVGIDGSPGSQVLTGLLIALPAAKGDSILRVRNLRSRPYIDMTLKMLRDFGIEIGRSGYETFQIEGGQRYRIGTYVIEGDWSAAAFILVAGAIAGRVVVDGLDSSSHQGDRGIIDALKAAGASVVISGDTVTVEEGGLKRFHYDATNCPDLIPPLVVLACNCGGKSVIFGADRLRHKESDRAHALRREFEKLGFRIEVDGNRVMVGGRRRAALRRSTVASESTGTPVDSHGDHRIAMALAVAGLTADGGILIEGPDCVAKSYPGFFEDLAAIGGRVRECAPGKDWRE